MQCTRWRILRLIPDVSSTTADEITKAERDLHFILETLDSETAFVFHKVEAGFCSKSCFSQLDLRFSVQSEAKRKVALKFNTLFKVEAKPEFTEALRFIRHCRGKPWPCFKADPDFKHSEKTLMLDITSEILAPLCTEVILENRYKADLSSFLSRRPRLAELSATLVCSDIGIGSIDTWHGTPDVRVRGGGHFVKRRAEDTTQSRGN